ncbi:MAG: hypothetical protein JEY96_14940 [Bacteroidales bacterium]|nr:hypothetical protein [Bacteroidales bacterium]
MEICIKAKSSNAGEYYNTIFTYKDDLLSVKCDCGAGIYGKFCKHKWQLLSGNQDMLFYKREQDLLNKVHAWAVEKSYLSLYKNIVVLENQQVELKKQIQKEKKALEEKLKNGF